VAYQREQAVVADAVRAAGAVIKEHFVNGAQVYTKRDNSPVTDADLAANAILVERLRAAFPADGILTEEAPPDDAIQLAPRCWIIDPLDGTASFVRREPNFAVMVALEMGGRPVLSAIYHPMQDELYAAVAGEGATLARDGVTAPLRFDPVPYETARIGVPPRSYRVLMSESPRWTGDPGRLMQMSTGFGYRPQVLMNMLDGYIGWLGSNLTSGGYPWDLCPTDLITFEAGGVLTDVYGELHRFHRAHERVRGGIVGAKDPALHGAMLGHLATTPEL
jgi:fructose-1,6-bisphosphatase/inositol monophosphatase family enzyme